MRTYLISITAGLSLLLPFANAAVAQGPTMPAPKQDTPPPAVQQPCSSASTSPLKPETRGQGGPELSDQLSKSNGVICPSPGIDPDITAPPPGAGKTPVIPPPGTPGGNPNVIPK